MAQVVDLASSMTARVLLALLVLPVVACIPSPYTVTQHGLISAPRPASYDGQPMPTATRVEAHAATTRVADLGQAENSGAAVARHHAGGAVRAGVNAQTDIGLEVDGAWSATESTLSGDNSMSSGVPDAAVLEGALALRTSLELNARMRLGLAAAFGMSSSPIHRDGTGAGEFSRDEALLVRAALVPSYRFDGVTLYGSLGGATLSAIDETFTVVPDSGSSNDPGVVAEAKELAFTGSIGATVHVADRVHLTAQLAQTMSEHTTFGPQLMAALAIDLGTPLAH